MVISDKHKYIFIAIPKTGTTAIQSFLLENDESCRWNSITLDGKQISISEHIKAKDLKKIMGARYEEYTVFTFIREPFARRVSGYFFYKNGDTKESRYFIRNLMAQVNTVLTRVLPFSLWSILKPQKKLVDYFFGKKGDLLIDLVGKTENLDEDLLAICQQIGIPLRNKKIPVKNKSKHSSTDDYYFNKLHRKLFSRMIKDDLELYDKYHDSLFTENYEDKRMMYD